MEETFNLVFTGELVRGVELLDAKANIAQLFKLSDSKVDALFSGDAITLKKNLDFATATKYRVAIKKAGCIVQLVANEAVDEPPQAAVAEPKAVNDSAIDAENDTNKQKPQGHASKEAAVSASSALSLAPAGIDLLAEAEKQPFEPAHVDVSRLSLKVPGADLLDQSEKTPEVNVSISTDSLDIAPIGSDVLSEQERETVPDINIDIGDISIAPVGVDLGQAKEVVDEVQPDISALRLEE